MDAAIIFYGLKVDLFHFQGQLALDATLVGPQKDAVSLFVEMDDGLAILATSLPNAVDPETLGLKASDHMHAFFIIADKSDIAGFLEAKAFG